MDAAEATKDLLTRVRARPWGAAITATRGGEADVVLDAGDDPLTERSTFQVGSITKTMTGVVLASAALAGEVDLTAPISDVLPIAGPRTHDHAPAAGDATQRAPSPKPPASRIRKPRRSRRPKGTSGGRQHNADENDKRSQPEQRIAHRCHAAPVGPVSSAWIQRDRHPHSP